MSGAPTSNIALNIFRASIGADIRRIGGFLRPTPEGALFTLVSRGGFSRIQRPSLRMGHLFEENVHRGPSEHISRQRPSSSPPLMIAPPSGRLSTVPSDIKNNFLGFSNTMPGAKTKKTYKRKNRKKTKRRAKRYKAIATRPPAKTLVRLESMHTVTLNPGSADAVSFLAVNLGNPITPFGTGVTATVLGSTHHPLWWDHYSLIYNKYQPISATVNAHFMHAGANDHIVGHFVVPTAEIATTETRALIADTNAFAPKLLESNRRAKVHVGASTAESSTGVSLGIACNIKKLEGVKKGAGAITEFQGTTQASSSESAPTRQPECYVGVGSISSESIDVTQYTVLVKLSYVILFSDLINDKGGASS